MKFKVRLATPEDIDLLIKHRNAMFIEMSDPTPAELRVMDIAYRRWALDLMRRKLFHGYVVTTSSGKPAASGCVWLREVQPSPSQPSGMVPYVLSVYTEPDYRRNGLASRVVARAMDWAKTEGFRKIVLHASKKGRKVYAKLGWQRTWEMEFAYLPPRPHRGVSRARSRPSRT